MGNYPTTTKTVEVVEVAGERNSELRGEEEGGSQQQEGREPASDAQAPERAQAGYRIPHDFRPVAEGEQALSIKLQTFEGPLDLLLALVREHELDILDLPMDFVVQKYLEYLDLFRDLNIDVAAEYLKMAADLTHIKSRMLLPTPDEDYDDEEEGGEDPRIELVRRLLEYQKYKDAAARLSARPRLMWTVFPRPANEQALNPDPLEIPLAEIDVYKLVEAFAEAIAGSKTTVVEEIYVERFTIAQRINELVEILQPGSKVELLSLIPFNSPRDERVVTFLAILEMAKLKMLRIEQDEQLRHVLIVPIFKAQGDGVVEPDGLPIGDDFDYH